MVHTYGCIDLIVKAEAFERQHKGFAKEVGKSENVPHGHYDSELICFPLGMSPWDAEATANALSSKYHFSLPEEKSANNSDSVIIAAPFGPTTECDWIEQNDMGAFQLKSGIKEWDTGKWLKSFEEGKKIRETHEPRIAVYKHTQKVCETGSYEINGKTVTLEKPGDSVVYNKKIQIEELRKDIFSGVPKIHVMNIDCLSVAKDLSYFNPLVLNMANRQVPGGGVIDGCGAQEECLFRSSNYYQTLYKVVDSYPLERNFGAVYSPNVTVFRDLEEEGYGLLETPFKTNFVAVPAIPNPDLTADGKYTAEMEQGTRNKVQTILNVAIAHGHKTLILSAFGCGAFHNPPEEMARIFKEELESPAYNNRFSRVVFAIKKDHNDALNTNFKAFADCFSDYMY